MQRHTGVSLHCAPLAKQSVGSLNGDCPCWLMTMYHCTGQTSYMGHSSLGLHFGVTLAKAEETRRGLHCVWILCPAAGCGALTDACSRLVVSWMYFSTIQMDADCCNFSYLYSWSGLIPPGHLPTFIYCLLLTRRPIVQPAGFRAKCQAGRLR